MSLGVCVHVCSRVCMCAHVRETAGQGDQHLMLMGGPTLPLPEEPGAGAHLGLTRSPLPSPPTRPAYILGLFSKSNMGTPQGSLFSWGEVRVNGYKERRGSWL